LKIAGVQTLETMEIPEDDLGVRITLSALFGLLAPKIVALTVELVRDSIGERNDHIWSTKTQVELEEMKQAEANKR
jgi:hypothetical protein